MDLSQLQGLLSPSADDKKQAQMMGLLGAGLGILSNNTGNYGRFGPAFGAGGMQGLAMQQQALQQARAEKSNQLQNAMLIDRLKKQGTQEERVNTFANSISDPIEKQRFLVDPGAWLKDSGIKYQDLGGSIGIMRGGQLIGTMAKTATPDAALREQGENSRYDRVSANTNATNQTSRANNAATVGASIYGTNVGAQTARDRLAFDANPNIQAGLAGARTAATETAKNTVGAQEALPDAQAKAAQVNKLVSEMIGSQQVVNGKVVPSVPGQPVVKPHPGFQSFVGSAVPGIDGMAVPGLKYIPGTSTADFKRRHEQLSGTVFLDAYQMLKGGGQITEIEGKKAESAKARMDSSQSEAEYISAAREFNQAVQDGLKKLQQRASGGYNRRSTDNNDPLGIR